MKLELFRPLTAIGRAGIAGVALLAGAAAFYLVAGVPLRAEVLALRAEVADARARLTGRLTPAERRDLQLSSFYSYFPQKDSTPLWLGKIYGAAKETGVTLASGEYELQRTKDMRLARYRISLPAQGSYDQVRRFIAAVLQEVPAAALEDVSLRREDIGSPELEARLRLTLYMDTGP
ncbi:MAG: hypothetical protein DIU74_011270 [Pseudomonadota bacterium]|nr:MAG: hypothetical protein DIU74_12650 [Pseudomonadota bacterium]